MSGKGNGVCRFARVFIAICSSDAETREPAQGKSPSFTSIRFLFDALRGQKVNLDTLIPGGSPQDQQAPFRDPHRKPNT